MMSQKFEEDFVYTEQEKAFIELCKNQNTLTLQNLRK